VIDVSQHQGSIDWQRVRQAGVEAAYIRATMGGTGVDALLASNAVNAAPHLLISSYHLFRPETEGSAQARHFLNRVQSYRKDMPLAVDVEAVQTETPLTPAQYADELAKFVQTIDAETREFPVIYTSASQWQQLVGPLHDPLFRQCPLWVAHYDVQTPALPRGWTSYWLWQYTSSGRVDGISGRVDLNRVGTPP
jgi:lysozyme